ncbi:MAG TPA: Na+/H+ antiporter subunit E [Actinomycetales bacterium]|nr:Na+/H+ antiporter subunit E [Actinomycetales bacterium]
MIQRRSITPVGVIWLTVVWIMLWGNISFANVIGGLVVALLVLAIFPLPRLIVGVKVRPIAFVTLLVRFLFDVVKASVHIAWVAVRPRAVPQSSVMVVQLVGREELFQTIVGLMVSLVPGSLVVDLDSRRGLLALHYFGVSDERKLESARADVLALEQRVLKALAADPAEERQVRAPARGATS